MAAPSALASYAPPPQHRRQTTVLLGGSNGTAALIAILGDRSEPLNAGHTVRVVSRNPSRFASGDELSPLRWRCDEQRPLSDFAPSNLLPTSWTTHVGEPDSVYAYDDEEEVAVPPPRPGNGDGDGDGARSEPPAPRRETYSGLERAISGLGAPDDGGPADVLLLCCPVSAHLPILRRIARALYRLHADGTLGPRRRPLLIGTLYAAGGFDWMARIAFSSLKPPSFGGVWSRELGLFGLKAFPYLCKSTKPGVVTVYGRYPLLTAAVCPSTPRMRARAKVLLERVLQCDRTGKYLHFLGLSAAVRFGGDGSAEEMGTDAAAETAYVAAGAAAAAAVAEGGRDKKGGGGVSGAAASFLGRPSAPAPIVDGSSAAAPGMMSMADHADPNASLAFLTCSVNATNQLLHPCIFVALFRDPNDPSASDMDGTIPWDAAKEKTKVPRFYADGAAKPEAGRLITAIGCGEIYPLMDCLERALAPAGGPGPISHMHGGEPVGKWFLETAGNAPAELGRRSGLTDMFLRRLYREEEEGGGDDDNEEEGSGDADGANGITVQTPGGHNACSLINHAGLFKWAMSHGLSHNSRLGSVLSPCLPVPPKGGGDVGGTTTISTAPVDAVHPPCPRIRPNVDTRFFTDDVPHGLCILLGLAEAFGFDLERDMTETLGVVRRLQTWMGKEYVVPADEIHGRSNSASGGGGNGRRRKVRIVADARDLAETSAPQAFGVRSVRDLRNFLALGPFADDPRKRVEERVGRSPLAEGLRSKL